MRVVRLQSGRMVYLTGRTMTIHPFDLRAVMALFLSKGKPPKSRRRLLHLTATLLERRGTNGMVRLSERLRDYHQVADAEVIRLIPEVSSTDG